MTTYQRAISENIYDFGRTKLVLGQTVYIDGEGDYRGTVRYIGKVDFASGDHIGVALDNARGNHDGSFRGRRYFYCIPDHGVFVRPYRLSSVKLIPSKDDTYLDSYNRSLRYISNLNRTGSPSILDRAGSPSGSSTASGSSSVRSILSRSRSTSPSPIITHRYSSASNNGGKIEIDNDLEIGDRVIVRSSVGESKTGILRYLGRVDFASGQWAGVQLFYPLGKNDGTVKGKHYFTCRWPYGLFVPSYKVDKSPANKVIQGSSAYNHLKKYLWYDSLPFGYLGNNYYDNQDY